MTPAKPDETREIDPVGIEAAARAIYAVLPNFGTQWMPNTSGGSSQERVDDTWEEAPDRHKSCRHQAEAAIRAYLSAAPTKREETPVDDALLPNKVLKDAQARALAADGGSGNMVMDTSVVIAMVGEIFRNRSTSSPSVSREAIRAEAFEEAAKVHDNEAKRIADILDGPQPADEQGLDLTLLSTALVLHQTSASAIRALATPEHGERTI